MDEKKSRRDKVIKFFGDKGFYIVLCLCVGVIGVSAWMISDSMGGLETEADTTVISTKVTAAPATPPVSSPLPTVEPLPPVTASPQPPEKETVDLPDEPAQPVYEGKPLPAEAMAAEDGARPRLFVWPTAGTVEMPHSVEALVYSRTMDDWRTHCGIDIATGLGGKVIAAAEGTVEQVYADDMLGTTVVIHHGGGLRSIYANLAQTPAVAAGDSVALGDTIGSVGRTALAEIGEATHLHFEMTLDGEPVDPRDYLPVR